MYQALYRKYRPSTFDDVYGQDHITSVLKTQLKTDKISHAYLFCGSRGTGKTTCAKIFAKAVNCEDPIDGEPCGKCAACRSINDGTCLDVVEMDAASNTGVDNIRRVCDEVQYLPSQVKKRVYIIDEVHMLSIGAFNALLKTIEEPPSHVLFIFATTELNQIPPTILSRCQRFDFKRINKNTIIENLMRISAKEGIMLERSAADVIARLSDGAMRDALSLLEACQGIEGVIDEEKISSLLGQTNRSTIIRLCEAIVNQRTEECIRFVDELYEKFSDFKDIIGSLISVFRDVLIIKTVPGAKNYVDAYDAEYDKLQEIASCASLELLSFQSSVLQDFYSSFDRISSQKRASCEILFIKLTSPDLLFTNDAILARISELENNTRCVSEKKETVAKSEKNEIKLKTKPEKAEIRKENEKNLSDTFDGSLKLKTLLQSEQFIKPWLPQISFQKEDNVLLVYSGTFVRGMLESCGAEKIILEHAKKVSVDIDSIRFVEKTNDAETQTDDGFGNL